MSIAALIPLLFAFAPQAAATDGALPAPTLPPGVSQDFQAAVRTVESALERGDFDAAKSALRLLPSPQFAIEYDDSKLPVELRQAGEAAIEAAAHDWSVDMTGVQIKIVRSHGDLKVDFTDKLAVPQGATMPSGLALIYSEAKDDPRLEAVIGVKRGEPLVESNVVDVSNDMKAAIGSYLGLAISPFFGTFMGTSDLSTNRPTTVFATEIHEARECLKVVTTLADAANSGKRMVSGSPKLFIDPTILELGESRQGDYVRFGIQVTNRGTAPMSYRLTPDCSCFSVVGPGTVDPGSSVFVRGVMSTAEYSGDIHKTLLLATSDPDQPMTKIPVHARINEMYRFIAPQGSLVVASDAAMVYHLYLALAPDSHFTPGRPQLSGVSGEVTVKPWSGMLADPDRNEPARQRGGYEYTVTLTRDLPPGRVPVTVAFRTDSEMFPTLMQTFYVQKGIVALPDRVYFGEMHDKPLVGTFLLTRPETGFKVLKIQCDSPNLTVTQRAIRGTWEHEFTVRYDGKAIIGNFNALIHITTNDPKQRVITVTSDGIVK